MGISKIIEIDPFMNDNYFNPPIRVFGKEYEFGVSYRFNCRMRFKKISIWIYW